MAGGATSEWLIDWLVDWLIVWVVTQAVAHVWACALESASGSLRESSSVAVIVEMSLRWLSERALSLIVVRCVLCIAGDHT